MLILDLNETMDQLFMANSMHWFGHVLRREDGNVWRSALEFEIKGQRNKARLIMAQKVLRSKDGNVWRSALELEVKGQRNKARLIMAQNVLRSKDGNVWRSALEFEIKGQRMEGRPERTWKMQIQEEYEGWCEQGRRTLWIKVDCWC